MSSTIPLAPACRFWRHGSLIEIERRVSWGGAISNFDFEPQVRYVSWRIRLNGRVIDRALSLAGARRLAEGHARKALLASASPPAATARTAWPLAAE